MSRPKIPTIPDNKIFYFREQLYRELSHMFKWEGLPTTVPADYLERQLIRHGTVLYYNHPDIGNDILRCEVTGYNRHELPVQARTFVPSLIENERTPITRNIKRLADSDHVVEDFDPNTDGVLITNTDITTNTSKYNPIGQIVNHFAKRLALVQQAFDTNLMWANVPYIFQTNSDETKQSIEKLFQHIFEGVPFIITDKHLYNDNKDRTGLPTDINFIGKDLLDVHNEIMMKFKQTVGFDTAGVDKAERTNTLEIQSNTQHTQTVLQIMLQQREKACEAINAFFDQNIRVKVVGTEDQPIEGGEGIGGSNSRTKEPTED